MIPNKANQVLDLFHSHKMNLSIKEWVDVKKERPKSHGIFKVRTESREEVFAYFYENKPCHWYDKKSGEPIEITHWGVYDE